MSRAIKKKPYKFVHVYWIDIQSDSSWRSIEDVKEEIKGFRGVELFLLGVIRKGSNIVSNFESNGMVMFIYQALSHYVLDIQPRAEQNNILRITLDSEAIKRIPILFYDKIHLGLTLITSLKTITESDPIRTRCVNLCIRFDTTGIITRRAF